MRILWVSNSGRVGTGYGNQTALFTRRLKAAGHEPAVFAYYGIEGTPSVDDAGIINLPRAKDLYGNDIVTAHAQWLNADVVIGLLDAFVLDVEVYQGLKWISWSPIDCEPIFPPSIPVLRTAKRNWAMSRHGEALLKQSGFTNVDYVPHGVDSAIFHPIDRREARARIGKALERDLTDKFLVVMNAANKGQPSRKGFFEALQAFKIFSDAHPEAIFYCHSETSGMWQGEDLQVVRQMVGLTEEKVIFPNRYPYIMGMYSQSYLNDMYNAGDVMLHPSHGEGFGIPLVEAQMAGCPIIATDFSAMSELNLTGWKVPGIPFMAAPGMLQRIPIVPLAAQALDEAYQVRQDGGIRGETARLALQYEASTVFQHYMIPALEKFASEQATMKEREAKRAELRKLARKGEAIPEDLINV